MKKTMLIAFSVSFLTSLFAAAPGKAIAYETVAEGYPAWAGLTEENYIYGRHLIPSDLRHKLTFVVFVDAADYEKQLLEIAPAFSNWNPSSSVGETEDTFVFPRSRISLVVLVGEAKKMPEPQTVRKFLSKNSQELQAGVLYIYANVSCSKAPDNGGKYPFYVVFGPEPGDPLASGSLDDAAKKNLGKLKRDKKNVLENWKPYYGTIAEPTAVKSFTKRLNSGKPLEALVADCQKGISNKDPEKAKECQILYDALEQTRSDLLFDIVTFAPTRPPRAVYEAQILMAKWPKSKKQLKPVIDKAKAIPDMKVLINMYVNMKKWGAEDFQCKNAGEAKKIVAELKKMKTTCDSIIQKSNSTVSQSVAAMLGAEAEVLLPVIESKVPVK